MKQIAIILMPKTLASALAIPLDMLGAANDIARAWKQTSSLVDIHLVSVGKREVELSNGLKVCCEQQLQALQNCDLVFIPGVWGNPRRHVQRYPELLSWLRRQHSQGAVLCSIVTGSHFLAEAGLLDNLAATTHWRFFDQFAQDYPSVKLQRKRFITRDNRLYCTGSVNAARDTMLHFTQQLYGEAITREVSQHFTHELKRSYESLLLDGDQQSTHHDELIIKIQEWLQRNYASPIQITELAAHFNLTPRSLNRRFKLAANTSPLQYLQEIRIEQAQALLKESNLGISEVADRVGYADASYFTGLFRKINRVTPNEYRRLVRNKLFVARA